MNKIFKFGLAVFAMLLVSAACFADISPKDKRCEGAWVGEDGNGFYFTKGKFYRIAGGMWFASSDLKEYTSDAGAFFKNGSFFGSSSEGFINCFKITSINGNTMKLEEFTGSWLFFNDENKFSIIDKSELELKKAAKIPPKSSKSYYEYMAENANY